MLTKYTVVIIISLTILEEVGMMSFAQGGILGMKNAYTIYIYIGKLLKQMMNSYYVATIN
ncbi:hypothetical protein LGK95_06965 [Clostridium algoriphilum]|uniref:hypothetical protein n=1 Tax=Clostridium algoriphilum TaxID=198347 RepID=UPI001CF2BF3F|nr:hypothetical protein [Clostridium algoriphilum]MCB2293258.1 hypothetical protein [Clostridium algoriphilum]